HLHKIADDDLRAQVESAFHRYADVKPRLATLPKGAMHNDLNDYNVLAGSPGDDDGGTSDLFARNQRITAILDFGDMVHGYRIGDLAVALAYALFDQPDPLAAAVTGLRGYASVIEPTEDELAVLFPLIGLRLVISACHAAHQQSQRPDDAYLSISQEPIRRLLPRLLTIPPALAECAFRKTRGLDPKPRARVAEAWLHSVKRQPAGLAPMLDTPAFVGLDLGPTSSLFEGDPNAQRAPKAEGESILIGRFGELRLRSASQDPDAAPFAPLRTASLGLDLWAAPGTAIHAPLAGHWRHHEEGGELHLTTGPVPMTLLFSPFQAASPQSTAVEAGQELGTIDDSGHLRLQLLVDRSDLESDPQAFCLPDHLTWWRHLYLDPSLVLDVPADLFPPLPPTREQAHASRRTHLGPSLSLSYRRPVHMARGWRQYLWDAEGRRYLDGYNNVPHVGHCHPRVVDAAVSQMRRLNTNTRYIQDTVNAYAERLAGLFPDPLEVCFFVNSATEANDLALRMARVATGRHDVLVQEAAYHGHTTTLIDISPYKHDGPGGEGAPPWVHTVPIPDVYRGPYGAEVPDVGKRYAADVATMLVEQGIEPAAFIAETCPSVGGQIMMPEGYLNDVYATVRQAGGLNIADEVQTGHGRIGTHMWAFEAHGVVPDMVVLGKPIGNGHPLAALITTREIADAFHTGMEFFSTFGGNTVSCAVGLAVLDVLEEEGLQAHALAVGETLLAGFRRLMERHALIGDVRGSGLFLGIELVRDRTTLEPAAAEASFIASRLRELGILIGTDGPHHNVLKVRPPMPFDAENADVFLTAFDQILREDFANP
ncbi:MAG: aminotransferase class III-fold pyridoxal phosphate-dependent enzyme, partial [Acidobacteriota bacterium]